MIIWILKAASFFLPSLAHFPEPLAVNLALLFIVFQKLQLARIIREWVWVIVATKKNLI
jgi:hypothetical protein